MTSSQPLGAKQSVGDLVSNSGIARPNLLECSRYLREECYSVSKMACYASADEDTESVHSLSEEEAMPETYKRNPKASNQQQATSHRDQLVKDRRSCLQSSRMIMCSQYQKKSRIWERVS